MKIKIQLSSNVFIGLLTFSIGFLYTFRGQFYITSKISVFSLLLLVLFTYKLFFLKRTKFSFAELLIYILLLFYPLWPNFIAMNKFGSFEVADYLRLIEGILILIIFSDKEFANYEYKYLFRGMLTSTIFSILLNYSQIVNYFLTGKFSLFVNPLYEEINYASSYYILVLSFCFMSILKNKGKTIFSLTKNFFFSLLIIIALLMSVSRSGFLGLTLLILVSVMIYSKGSVLRKLGLVFLGAIPLIFLSSEFQGIFEVIMSRFSSITHPYGGKIDPRFIVWREAIIANLLNPFGIGLNNIRYYTSYGIPEHNTILQAWSAYGLITVLFIRIIFKNLKMFITSYLPNRDIDILIILLIFSYIPFVLTLNLLTSRHFWVIIALIISRNRLNNKNRILKN
ncbi:O-Antigen ligase [Proteiniborus ethanoligenes]|uniref:O-Antigen ligase n=1 Tax=Proteiniborus ethanoligenes TaxID=415015 RepID=A0A1H3LQ11_9FIRM|nr:O-antigen ligase family protein [Proteiniborus ethanoligenes]SDY66522.1 O-Antigen ligase [Proteiniborus ethanoligenes]